MPIFKISGNELHCIKEDPFALEKHIQSITEENLPIIFNLEFVRSEFHLNSLQIDILAFSKETNSFVIIEFKKDRNFSVIDQGYAYLGLMLNNKAEFILEYNEKTGRNIRREDIDWTQSKVMFISPKFTKYQQKAINFKDLPIELWEVTYDGNNTILFNQLKSQIKVLKKYYVRWA